ncbi:MAG: hypothetical protein WKF76_09740 [Nocardioidaceae bacterium]
MARQRPGVGIAEPAGFSGGVGVADPPDGVELADSPGGDVGDCVVPGPAGCKELPRPAPSSLVDATANAPATTASTEAAANPGTSQRCPGRG